MKGVVEGFWDCPYCGTRGIRGRYYYCPNCGKGRGKETKFYPPTNISESDLIEDREDIRDPDHYCEYCDSYINYKFKFCPNCGAEKGKKDYFDVSGVQRIKPKAQETRTDYEEPQYEDTYEEREEEPDDSHDEEKDSAEDYTSTYVQDSIKDDIGEWAREIRCGSDLFGPIVRFFQNNFKAIAIFLGVIAAVTLLVVALIPKYETVDVTGKSWTRTIDIESYDWVERSDWSVPPGGVLQRTNREIHHYEKVFDHTETYQESHQERYISGYRTVTHDRGNGYFDVDEEPVYSYRTVYETKHRDVYRDEPVYRTKYYYLIQEWVYNRSYTSSGKAETPYWPEYELADSDERVGAKHETYKVTAMKKDKERNYITDFKLWQEIEVGHRYKFKVQLGSIIEFEKLS